MNVLFILLAVSLLAAATFLLAFIWAVKTGQFDDTSTPAMRILTEEERMTGKREPLEEETEA